MKTLTIHVTECSSGILVITESSKAPTEAHSLTNQQTMVITLDDVEIAISRRLPDTADEAVGYIDPAIDGQLAAL